jgi:hypothetical protein
VSVLHGPAGVWLGQRSPTRGAVAWILAVAGPALLTLASVPLRSSLVLGGFLFSALLVVIAVAVIGGTRPALTAVVLCGLTRVVFFAPPFTAGVDLQANPVSLAAFTITGATVAILIGELAQLAEEHSSSGQVEAALRRVATLVARGAPASELFAAVPREAGQLLRAGQTSMIHYGSDGTSTVVASWRRTGEALPAAGARERLGGRNLSTIISQTRRPARIDSYADASGPIAVSARNAGFHSAAGAPIIVRSRLWGAVIACMVDEHPLPPGTEARLAS